jgi:hypothetical protein
MRLKSDKKNKKVLYEKNKFEIPFEGRCIYVIRKKASGVGHYIA